MSNPEPTQYIGFDPAVEIPPGLMVMPAYEECLETTGPQGPTSVNYSKGMMLPPASFKVFTDDADFTYHHRPQRAPRAVAPWKREAMEARRMHALLNTLQGGTKQARRAIREIKRRLQTWYPEMQASDLFEHE